MGTPHSCRDNDHLSALAKRYCFEKWKTIWDDPANQSLRNNRPSPNLLFKKNWEHPGDIVVIPDPDPKSVGAPTEQHTKCTTGSYKLHLRLRLLKRDLTPLAKTGYTLTVGNAAPIKGVTDDKGQLEVEIPQDATHAKLTARIPPESDGSGTLQGEVPMNWEVRIGALNPIVGKEIPDEGVSGVQQRLSNLGFFRGLCDGKMTRETELAIKSFRQKYKVPEGDPMDRAFIDKLVKVHDTPDSVVPPEKK